MHACLVKLFSGVVVTALTFGVAGQSAGAASIQRSAASAAATIVVNTSKGDYDLEDNLCSIREAMMRAANNDINNTTTNDCAQSPSGNTTINFAVASITPDDTGGLPDTANRVVLNGPVTFNAVNVQTILFDVESSGSLNLVNVSIKNSKYTAIDSRGTLNIAGGKFENNSAAGAGGGAIRTNGPTMIAGVTFVNNKAVAKDNNEASKSGGAIRSTWALTIAGSTFTGNTSDYAGGAIMVQAGRLSIQDSAFTGNVAKGLPHDLDHNGDGGTIGIGGGAIATAASGNTYPMTIKRTAFQANVSLEGSGGAIFHDGGTSLTISDSSFQGNHAGKPGKTGAGGAIFNLSELIVKRSTFTANSVLGDGGAIANDADGQVTLQMDGFAGNNASGKGGAFLNSNITSSEAKVTAFGLQVTGNVAGSGGGGIYNHDSKDDTFEVRGSVWAGNLPENCKDKQTSDENTPDPDDEEQWPVDSKGQNFFSDASCEADEENDDANPGDPGFTAEPELAAPSANGGPPGLLTMAPAITSPLVDKIPPQNAPTEPELQFDIRGMPRGMNGTGFGAGFWDIGPYERDDAAPKFSSLPVAPGPINIGSGATGVALTKSSALRVFNGGDIPLTLSALNIGGANAGDFALTLPPSVSPGGVANIDITCTPGSTGARSATATFGTNDANKASVSFNLTCTGVAGAQATLDSSPAKPGGLLTINTTLGTDKGILVGFFNIGNSALNISAETFVSDPAGAFTNTPLPASIAANSNVLRSFTCVADALGVRSAKLTFTTNEPGNPTRSYDLVCNVSKPEDRFIADTLSTANGLGAGSEPYGVAISPDGKHVYAAASDSSEIALFAVNSNTLQLTHVENLQSESLSASSRFTTPYQLAVSADGRNVYATGYASNSFVTFARDADTGKLTHVDTVREGAGYDCVLNQGCAGQVSGLVGAYGIALSPDGKFIYVSSISGDSIVVFRRDSNTGAASSTTLLGSGAYFVERITRADLNGAYGIAISPDGAHLYATGYLADTLLTFQRDPGTGQLTHRQSLSTTTDLGLNGVFRVTLSPDGLLLYTASYISNETCAFKRNTVTGALTRQSCSAASSVKFASDVAVAPDGKFLLSTAFGSDSVTVYRRDSTGTLSQRDLITPTTPNGSAAMDGLRGIVFHPSGQAAYASSLLGGNMLTLLVGKPKPAIAALTPASLPAGSGDTQIALTGEGIHPSSRVFIGLDQIPATFINSTRLLVSVPAAKLANTAELPLVVLTNGPGGGQSNSVKLYVLATGALPVPSISSINLPGVLAGASSAVVEINGSGFAPGAVALVNGTARPSERVSDSLLRATLNATDLENIGSLALSVSNTPIAQAAALSIQSTDVAPSTSAPVVFQVSSPNNNPPPGIGALSPANVPAQGNAPEVDVTISGVNFVLGAQAYWNGEARPTVFLNASTLRMTISAADLILPGLASVTVSNPAPGGGESAVLTFTIDPAVEPPPPQPPTFRVHVPLIYR
jgi:6-phosphogluconolactonase (cycloisomerase 2 family)